MAYTYESIGALYATRRSGRNYKRFSHNQQIEFDRSSGAYMHRHHRTVTVVWFPDGKVRLDTGGWDTITTWKKIHDVVQAPWLWRGNANIPTTAVERKFLGRPERFSPYFDGIEFTGGYVHNPEPYHKRICTPGSAKPFTQVRRAVWERIGPRVLIGEFDQRDEDDFMFDSKRRQLTPTDPKVIWQLMQTIAGLTPGVDVERSLVTPLLVPRPQTCFGRGRYNEAPTIRTGMQLLNSSFRAALRCFHTLHDDYKIIEVKGYE